MQAATDNGNGSYWAQWATILDDPDLLALVPRHWLSFRPPPAKHHLALAATYIPLVLAGLLGNGAVVYLFFT